MLAPNRSYKKTQKGENWIWEEKKQNIKLKHKCKLRKYFYHIIILLHIKEHVSRAKENRMYMSSNIIPI